MAWHPTAPWRGGTDGFSRDRSSRHSGVRSHSAQDDLRLTRGNARLRSEAVPAERSRAGQNARSQLLKIGYKASAEQFGPRELLEFAREADRLGYDSVFISDHFQPW